MCEQEAGAGPEMPAQDRALIALADVLEGLGEEACQAFVDGGPAGSAALTSCQNRAATVAQAIVGLPAVTLHGASAKARASVAVALLPTELVDALGFDMAHDVIRDAVREVRPGTVAGSRAAARIAARSLVEMGDDASDLVGIVQSYAAALAAGEPAALAWSAVEGLLATMPKP